MRVTTFLACFAALAAAASHADAQTRASAIPVVWQAPVGHFQPRARDIPPDISLSLPRPEQEALDRAFDDKLKICRGC
jgi:hypothetical protein